MFETNSKKWLVESARVSLYALALLLITIFYFFQKPFISINFLITSYVALSIGSFLHIILFFLIDKFKEDSKWVFATFFVDSILLTIFVHYSGSYQSLFLLIHILNIIFCSFLFKGPGAISIALVSSIVYSWSQIFVPEFRSLNSILILAINNLAFFGVAGLSGFLNEKLFQAEKEIQKKDTQLKSLEDLYELIIEKSPVGVLTVNSESQIVQLNMKAITLFPLIKNEEPLINFFEPLSPYWKEIVSLTKSEAWIKELTFFDRSELFVYRVVVSHLSQSNDLWLVMIEDLSEIRKIEMHLKQSEKLAAIGGLAAGVAHEIRNPLAGISGSVELLSQTTNNDDDKKLMKIILKEIDRLNLLISEFLDYAKPEKPPTDQCDLSSIMKEVLANVNSSVSSAHSRIRNDVVQVIEIEESVFILGYKDKLKQAFFNIIINAYQAMDKTESPKVEIKLFKKNNKCVLHIKDSGSGMSEETRKRLFEPFYTTKAKGTGLGLAITHKILDVHKATINVQSELGQGTLFEFNFPCVEV